MQGVVATILVSLAFSLTIAWLFFRQLRRRCKMASDRIFLIVDPQGFQILAWTDGGVGFWSWTFLHWMCVGATVGVTILCLNLFKVASTDEVRAPIIAIMAAFQWIFLFLRGTHIYDVVETDLRQRARAAKH